MKKLWIRLGFLLLVPALLLLALEQVTADLSLYERLYRQYDIPVQAGVEETQLMEVTAGLVDYIYGGREALDMEAVVFGRAQRAFNEREQAHMVDVRQLFQLASMLCRVLLIAGAALLALGLLWPKPGGARELRTGSLFSVGCWLAILGGLALLAGFNFQAAFWQFHQLFFRNDLWLLNPATDLMIRMFPEPFFFEMVKQIGLRALLLTAGLVVAAGLPHALTGLVRRLLGTRQN